MGTTGEQWKQLVDLRASLRIPVTLLVAALLCYGFFPQSFVQMVAPKFRTYLSTNRTDLSDTKRCSHGAVRRPLAVAHEANAPQGRGYNTCRIAYR